MESTGSPADSVVKNPPVNAGDTGDVGSIPGLGQSPGEGNGNPLQDSRLGNPMDRGAWQGYSPRGHKRVGHEHAHKHSAEGLGSLATEHPQ